MTTASDSPSGRRATWAAGLVVAAGAGVATAHGLYQVAAAARVPAPIAWLYPLITDGLALVAYAATARLHRRRPPLRRRHRRARRRPVRARPGRLPRRRHRATTSAAPVGLRFGVGAWPAIAAALTAHLLHLISTDPTRRDRHVDDIASTASSVQSAVQPGAVQSGVQRRVQSAFNSRVQPRPSNRDADAPLDSVRPPG